MRLALRLLLPLLVLAACLSACRRDGQDRDGRITIRFSSLGNAEEAANIQHAIEAFEKIHPDIRVQFIHVPANYEHVLLTMFAGGRGPDMFVMSPPVLESYTSKGLLLNLEPYIAASDSIHLEDYYPQTVEAYRFDGRVFGQGPLYGLCKDWSPDRLVFYNKKLFDEAGLPYPDGSWDRDEFVEVAKALTRRDERGRVIQFGVYNNCEIDQWIAQSGGRLFSEDGTRCLLDDPATLDGLQYCADLTVKHHVSPGAGEAAQFGTENVMFETGRVAMCFYGLWIVPIFEQNIRDFEWGVTTPPRHTRNVNLSLGMVGYGINARSAHPRETWLFLEHMAGPWGQRERARMGWNIPSSRAVAEGPDFLGNPDLNQEAIRVFLDALESTEYMEINPYIVRSEFDLFFRPEWDKVFLGQQTAHEAAQKVTPTINRTIRDNMAIMGIEP